MFCTLSSQNSFAVARHGQHWGLQSKLECLQTPSRTHAILQTTFVDAQYWFINLAL
jgi:hypothetical protein